jgi:hypothetical protein
MPYTGARVLLGTRAAHRSFHLLHSPTQPTRFARARTPRRLWPHKPSTRPYPRPREKVRAVVEKSRRSFSTPSFTFACFPIVHPLPRRIPWFWNVSLCCPSEFRDGHGCQKEYPCSAPLPPGRRTTCQQ